MIDAARYCNMVLLFQTPVIYSESCLFLVLFTQNGKAVCCCSREEKEVVEVTADELAPVAHLQLKKLRLQPKSPVRRSPTSSSFSNLCTSHVPLCVCPSSCTEHSSNLPSSSSSSSSSSSFSG